jgi:hypothetical protein
MSRLIAVLHILIIANLSAISFAEEPNYEIYEKFLERHVSEGTVDYASWKADDFIEYTDFILVLRGANIEAMTKDEEKAFWINTYNALTIYGVLKDISVDPVLAVSFSTGTRPGFFTRIRYNVGGEDLSLEEIKDAKLRERFKDPRVHFALSPATVSGPEIQKRPFFGSNIEERLDYVTTAFIRDESKNRLDKDEGRLYLSQIFKWYRSDFVEYSGIVELFVAGYLIKEDSDYIKEKRPDITYLHYNRLSNAMK